MPASRNLPWLTNDNKQNLELNSELFYLCRAAESRTDELLISNRKCKKLSGAYGEKKKRGLKEGSRRIRRKKKQKKVNNKSLAISLGGMK